MSKWSFSVQTWTPVAVADATNFTDAGHMSLKGGSTTQIIRIEEIFMGGQATASAPSIMVLGRNSTVGATPSALASPNSAGPLHPSVAAMAAVPVAFRASTTKPQRSNSVTVGKLNLSFNAFGGVVRWLAAPGEEWTQLGSAASIGESSLSAFTGGTPGLMGTHIVFEPL